MSLINVKLKVKYALIFTPLNCFLLAGRTVSKARQAQRSDVKSRSSGAAPEQFCTPDRHYLTITPSSRHYVCFSLLFAYSVWWEATVKSNWSLKLTALVDFFLISRFILIKTRLKIVIGKFFMKWTIWSLW